MVDGEKKNTQEIFAKEKEKDGRLAALNPKQFYQTPCTPYVYIRSPWKLSRKKSFLNGSELFSSLLSAPSVSFCAPLKFPSIYIPDIAASSEPFTAHFQQLVGFSCGAHLLFLIHTCGAGGLSTWSEVNSEVHPPDSPLMEINPH